MQKTVFALIVSLAFVFSAAGQANTDSLKMKTTIPFTLKDSLPPNPFFVPAIIPANFYATHLPFFCDKELKLQKALKMSIKFRLGSIEACNKLEGKY
jgi:hypothetical protein